MRVLVVDEQAYLVEPWPAPGGGLDVAVTLPRGRRAGRPS